VRQILGQAGLLLLSLIVLYGAVLGLTLLIVPPHHQIGGLDTETAASSLFMTSPRYLVFNRESLGTPGNRVLLMGTSNVAVGLKQKEVQAEIPGAIIDNIAMGHQNISEMREIVDLVYAAQDHEVRRGDIFVIGTWFGLFLEDRYRWYTPDRHGGDTDIDIELYRYGFYRHGSAGPVPVLPASEMRLGLTLIHPYLALERIVRDAGKSVHDSVLGPERDPTPAELDAAIVTDAKKRDRIDYWARYMGGSEISYEQFAILEKIVETILGNGGRVIIVDLPLARWMEQASPQFPPYGAQMKIFLEHFVKRRGFSYFDMQNFDDPEDFYDEVHPRPRVAKIWAHRLAQMIGPLLEPGPQSGIARAP
jgi:hypothetical protein